MDIGDSSYIPVLAESSRFTFLVQVVTQISIPGQLVVEGISPIWADLNGDGQSEIIVALSEAEQGAQVAVYSESGSRWRLTGAIVGDARLR